MSRFFTRAGNGGNQLGAMEAQPVANPAGGDNYRHKADAGGAQANRHELCPSACPGTCPARCPSCCLTKRCGIVGAVAMVLTALLIGILFPRDVEIVPVLGNDIGESIAIQNFRLSLAITNEVVSTNFINFDINAFEGKLRYRTHTLGNVVLEEDKSPVNVERRSSTIMQLTIFPDLGEFNILSVAFDFLKDCVLSGESTLNVTVEGSAFVTYLGVDAERPRLQDSVIDCPSLF